MQNELSISFTKKYWASVSSTYQILVYEVSTQNNKGYIGAVYRSPGQDASEFNFFSDFETILSDTTTSNALFTILSDFNARSSAWRTNDITTTEGTKLESLTTVYGFYQLMS